MAELDVNSLVYDALKMPIVRVDRNKFLAEWFANSPKLDAIISLGPVNAGVSPQQIKHLSHKLIVSRTTTSSLASFAAGLPGGIAAAAVIPADVLQYFAFSLRLAQEISYLYGADDLWNGDSPNPDAINNQLILYLGVMFGAAGASAGARLLAAQLSRVAAKKLPQVALMKTFWYPIVKQICKAIGVRMTRQIAARTISKIIPVVGGVVSGTLNYATMYPMAERLSATLYDGCFDYSDDEMADDIKIIKQMSVQDAEYTPVETEERSHSQDNPTSSSDMDKVIKQLKDLKELLDQGVLTQEEFSEYKSRLLKK